VTVRARSQTLAQNLAATRSTSCSFDYLRGPLCARTLGSRRRSLRVRGGGVRAVGNTRAPHLRPLGSTPSAKRGGIILHAASGTVRTYLQGVHMHVLEKLMPLPPQIPQLVTLGEGANRLAVSKRHLQRLVARGELPTVRVGECVRISTAVLVAFIASKTRIG